MDQKKEAEEILNIVKEGMKIHFNLLQEKINNRIAKFNEDIGNFTGKIKEITMNFTQGDQLKNSEQYNSYLNELFLSNEQIVFNNIKESNSFIDKIRWIFENIKYFFISKNDVNIITEKINELQKQILHDLKMKNRSFNLKLEDQSNKIKDNFKSILSLSFSDLSNIEEKEWKECIELYYEARKSLLSTENQEEIEKQIEQEKIEEKKSKKEEEIKDEIKDEGESKIEGDKKDESESKIEGDKKGESESKIEEDKKEEKKEESETKKEEEKEGEKKE